MRFRPLRSSFESRENTLDQNFVIEWFSQKLNSAASHGLHAHFHVSL